MAAVIPLASEAPRAASRVRLAALAAVLVAVVLLYWPAVLSLHVLWVDGELTTYTHGYLIVGLSCWLLFRDRAQLAQAAGHGPGTMERLAWLAVLLGTGLLWEWMYRAGIQIAVQMLLPALLLVSIGATFGWRTARVSLFPLAFLVFAIPIWDYLNPVVHELTVVAVRLILRMIGIPVYFTGDEVHIPEGVFEIEDGCSGLHFLMVALAIGTFVGELRGSKLRGRLGWLALAAAFAILVNWFRVSTIVLLGHYTDMQHYIVRVSHYYYGWVLFAIALIVYFALERRVPLPPEAPPAIGRGEPARSVAITPWLVVVIVIAAVPAAMNRVIDTRMQHAADVTRSPTGWSTQTVEQSGWRPVQVGADREFMQIHTQGGNSVEAYLAQYFVQHPAKKLGGSGNRIEGDAAVLAMADVSGPLGAWGEMKISEQDQASLVWFQYRAAGHTFVSATRAQLVYGMTTMLSLQSTPASVRALRVRCANDDECIAARETLRKFISDEG